MWSRGTKRGASDSNLSDFERFEKRLRLLSIRGSERKRNGTNNNIYTPVTNSSATTAQNGQPDHISTTPQNDDELMQVDDTCDRVYIHDLDAELADIESDEEKLIFLPDIEKKLSKLPARVLQGGREDDHDGQELVLYHVPKSLTVDESHDSVRKAIIEARQRAREKAAEDAKRDMERRYDHSEYDDAAEPAHGYTCGYGEGQSSLEDDPDAMDIG